MHSEIPELVVKGLKIDPNIFTFKFACECKGDCCHHGVYTDLDEHHVILREHKALQELMDETQTTDIKAWFEAPEEDPEFNSGIAVGTEVHNGKCVFLNKEGHCVIQKLAYTRNEYQWKYKPLYCILFPLTIYEGALTIDDEHIARAKTCNIENPNGTVIFDYCTPEIKHLVGEENFLTMLEYRNTYFPIGRSVS